MTAKLEDAGLKIGTVTQDDSSTEAANIVLSTNPAPGSSVSEGSVVDIVVSSGKNSPKTLRYDVGLPSGVDQDILLKVYRSGTLVDTQTINPAYDSTYTLEFTGTSGVETVVVELDGQNYLYLDFDFDSSNVRETKSFDYVPSGGSDEPDSSSSESSENSSSDIAE